MKTLLRIWIASLALLAAAPAAAQGGGMHPDRDDTAGHQPGDGHAFRMLLERRGELGLTPAQAQRLEAIGERLEASNRPLRERLAAERQRYLAERRAQLERMTPEQRRAEFERMRHEGRPPLPPSMQPVAAEMRRNIQEAMREAHGVLTPPQRPQVRRMLREARERRGAHGGSRRGAWRGRRNP
jgi:DNA-binding MarR family transcriptional regulator